MRIQSVFGSYADRLQVIVDTSLARFSPVWFERFFDWGVTQTSLTFTSVLGASRIEAAASVIERDSPAPLRSRAALAKLTGEIPAIAEKFALSQQDYRDFLALQNMSLSDQTKRQQLLDLTFGDVKRAGDGAMKRLDFMCLEAVSTGFITVTIDNNPDGIVSTLPIPLGMPDTNRVNAAIAWSNSASSTPITDINNIVSKAEAEGRSFDRILMGRAAFTNFANSAEVKDKLGTYLNLKNVAKVMPTLSNVNEFLGANLFPAIELVNESIGIEKNGVISAVRPFSDTNVAFIPAGRLGKIHNAFAIEELKPVQHVSYAKYKQALISKWQENEPFREYTKVELNAFPGLDTIDGIFLLSTSVAF